MVAINFVGFRLAFLAGVVQWDLDAVVLILVAAQQLAVQALQLVIIAFGFIVNWVGFLGFAEFVRLVLELPVLAVLLAELVKFIQDVLELAEALEELLLVFPLQFLAFLLLFLAFLFLIFVQASLQVLVLNILPVAQQYCSR